MITNNHQETAQASLIPAHAASTLCEAFQITAAERPTQVALRTPADEVSITWATYADRVRRIAGGLAALGVRRGDTVGLMLVNRPEFHLVDTAVLHLGATPFSIYNSSAQEQIAHMFGNAGNRVVVTERAFVPAIREALPGTQVAHIVLVDDESSEAFSLDQLEGMGEADFDFDATWREVMPTDLATLIYTSGTTGPPKGVELTHANLLAQIRAVHERLSVDIGGRTMSYLPSAHLADRWMSHYQGSIGMGFTVTCIADPATVVTHLPDCRPTAWGGVPRVFEKVKAALEAQGIIDPSALSEAQRAGIVAKLGLDQCVSLFIGGSPVQDELVRYFHGLGLPLGEVLGMSETSCLIAANPPSDIRIGSAGPPLRGMEAKLEGDGELLVRGPLVMVGYRGEPERTKEVIDEDGWFHTGDIAEIDAEGYISIVDRKKELIINAAGKNMSPANIELTLKSAHSLIGQAVAIGDNRPYNVALIVLDPDASGAFAEAHAFSDGSVGVLAKDERIRDVIATAIDAANARLSRVEQIKRFTILDVDWSPDSDELTPTMKLKRKPIAAKYADLIEQLYADEGATQMSPA